MKEKSDKNLKNLNCIITSKKDKMLNDLLEMTYTINKKKIEYYSPLVNDFPPKRSNKIRRGIDHIQKEINEIKKTPKQPLAESEKNNGVPNKVSRFSPEQKMPKLEWNNSPIENNLKNKELNLTSDELLTINSSKSNFTNDVDRLTPFDLSLNRFHRKLNNFKKEFASGIKKYTNKPVINLNKPTLRIESQSIIASSKPPLVRRNKIFK